MGAMRLSKIPNRCVFSSRGVRIVVDFLDLTSVNLSASLLTSMAWLDCFAMGCWFKVRGSFGTGCESAIVRELRWHSG